MNLSTVDHELIDLAEKSLTEGDILGVMRLMPNTRCMAFVVDNNRELQERGFYEEALFDAYTATRTNFSRWSFDLIKFLFEIADKEKLLRCCDPLPGEGPYVVYRGVSGRGVARRVRGISWTADLDRAIWFAERFKNMKLEKPAVFKATVNKSMVYAFSNDRQEAEFLCNIPSGLRLKKVWPKSERR